MGKAPACGPWGVASRAVAAAVGGYLLASVLPVPFVALWPMARVDAVLAAMTAGFVVYAAAVLWAFAARSAGVAWAGLAGALALSALAAWVVL
ncbi:hypothetical protein LJR039_002220 [Pseudorhodoferax sp. LjRoot39]|uniref:hypothetical protein n=1 Tax=Pseudorhodoferax sp. LjRoot39 TaxID=3342328 RepID=UPI003ECF70C3